MLKKKPVNAIKVLTENTSCNWGVEMNEAYLRDISALVVFLICFQYGKAIQKSFRRSVPSCNGTETS